MFCARIRDGFLTKRPALCVSGDAYCKEVKTITTAAVNLF